MNKKIYIVCSVRNADMEEQEYQREYARDLRRQGYEVFFPPDDAPQTSETGFEIVMIERDFIRRCDEVHVFWNTDSKGSHCDLGMAFMADKPIIIVKEYQPDSPHKSYVKVIKEYMKKFIDIEFH